MTTENFHEHDDAHEQLPFNSGGHAAAIREDLLAAAIWLEEKSYTWTDDNGITWSATCSDAEPFEELHKLKDMSVFASYGVLKNWNIQSFYFDIDDDYHLTSYKIITDKDILSFDVIMRDDYTIPSERFEDTDREDMPSKLKAMIQEEAAMRRSTEQDLRPSLPDYEECEFLLAAVRSGLSERTNQAINDYLAYMEQRTPDEVRMERLAKITEIITFDDADVEVDKTAGPVWWGITLDHMAFGIRTRTWEEALYYLETHLDTQIEYHIIFIHQHEVETNEKLDEQYPSSENEPMRFIPFSTVLFPDDPENMNDEQRQAFDKLR